MSSPLKVPKCTLLLILLVKWIPYSCAYGIEHIKLSVINFEDSKSGNAFEKEDNRNDHFKSHNDLNANVNPFILEENIPFLEKFIKSEVFPGENGLNQVGNKVPFQKETIESNRNPNIDVIENTLGTDRSGKREVNNDLNLHNVEKPDGKIALEAIPIKKELDNEKNNNGEFDLNETEKNLKDKTHKKKVSLGESPLRINEGDEKNRKIIVIPIRDNTGEKTKFDNANEDSNDSNSLSHEKRSDTTKQSDVLPTSKVLYYGQLKNTTDLDNDKSTKQSDVLPTSKVLYYGQLKNTTDLDNDIYKTDKTKQGSTTDNDGSITQEGKGKKHFVFQSGLSQDALNAVSDSKNSQLNIDQNNAKEPLTVLESNKNYGEQKYIENSETNINTNLFLDHKLQRREDNLIADQNEIPCETTINPCTETTTCETTTTSCPTTTTPCPTTTTTCETTTTPCPTTTTPCPTTTTTCETTTTPCTTTTTPCPTTTTPCPTTTTTCETTTTPCPTTTTPCPTTTTPCPTTTTTCETTTTPYPTTTTPYPTTTTPCPTTTTPCPTTTTPCPTTTTTCPTTTTSCPTTTTTCAPPTTTKKPCESGTTHTQDQTNNNNGGIISSVWN